MRLNLASETFVVIQSGYDCELSLTDNQLFTLPDEGDKNDLCISLLFGLAFITSKSYFVQHIDDTIYCNI